MPNCPCGKRLVKCRKHGLYKRCKCMKGGAMSLREQMAERARRLRQVDDDKEKDERRQKEVKREAEKARREENIKDNARKSQNLYIKILKVKQNDINAIDVMDILLSELFDRGVVDHIELVLELKNVQAIMKKDSNVLVRTFNEILKLRDAVLIKKVFEIEALREIMCTKILERNIYDGKVKRLIQEYCNAHATMKEFGEFGDINNAVNQDNIDILIVEIITEKGDEYVTDDSSDEEIKEDY